MPDKPTCPHCGGTRVVLTAPGHYVCESYYGTASSRDDDLCGYEFGPALARSEPQMPQDFSAVMAEAETAKREEARAAADQEARQREAAALFWGHVRSFLSEMHSLGNPGLIELEVGDGELKRFPKRLVRQRERGWLVSIPHGGWDDLGRGGYWSTRHFISVNGTLFSQSNAISNWHLESGRALEVTIEMNGPDIVRSLAELVQNRGQMPGRAGLGRPA